MKTAEGNDALALIDRQGTSVTQSQLAILRMAQCEPNIPAIPRDQQHHALMTEGPNTFWTRKQVLRAIRATIGVQVLTYERLKHHVQAVKGTLFKSQDLVNAIDRFIATCCGRRR